MEALKMERTMENWNDDRLDELSRRMDDGFKEMREGFARMVTREEMKELIASINVRFEQIDKRFDQVDKRFDQVDKRFDQVDKRFDRLENRVDRLYYGCLALLVLLIGNSILGTVLS
jgi:archaellum component FlaC